MALLSQVARRCRSRFWSLAATVSIALQNALTIPFAKRLVYTVPTFLMIESDRKSRGSLKAAGAATIRPRIKSTMPAAFGWLSSASIVSVLITCLAGKAPRVSISSA